MRRILILLMMLSVPAAQAGVYSWVDAEGNTHFGDRPPADVAPKQVEVDAAPVSVDNAARARQEKMNDFLEERQKERKERQAATAKADKAAAKKSARCTQLRAELKNLESISTFYRVNLEGEREYVSDTENEEIRVDLRKKVREYCG